jgi:hypothetical protein
MNASKLAENDSLFRQVGVSLLMLVGILSFSVFRDYVSPLPVAMFIPCISLYFYLNWTRPHVQKTQASILNVYLFSPVIIVPLVCMYYFLPKDDTSSATFFAPAFLMGLALNLIIWGKRACPPKRLDSTISG